MPPRVLASGPKPCGGNNNVSQGLANANSCGHTTVFHQGKLNLPMENLFEITQIKVKL